ncbi:MAG: carbohydrate ABC transporter permease [Fimbriimonadaceae bacterium]
MKAESRAAWWCLAPAMLHWLLFAAFPIGFSVVLALFDWQIVAGTNRFVGLDQFRALAEDGPFWSSMMNSLRYAAWSVPLGMAFALAVALLVAKPLRGMPFFRTLFYTPSVMSGVAISMVWLYIYMPERGLVNTLTGLIGLPEVNFLSDPQWAMPALALMGAVVGLGPRMVVYVAALLAVPPSLGEAADLDGANWWQKLRNVTLPMIAPTSLFVLVTSTIGALQLFTPIYLMTKGGPMGTTDVVGYHIYTTAWQRFEVSQASAQSCVALLLIGLVTLVQFRLSRRAMEGYSPA